MVQELVGQTLAAIEGAEQGSEEIRFIPTIGPPWRMFHIKDCCEEVLVEDVVGDVEDLIGTPIVSATEASNDHTVKPGDCSGTWTFYRISTIKGTVVIRWYGTGRGHYSESVDLAWAGATK